MTTGHDDAVLNDGADAGAERTGLDRRSLLKKAGIAGAAAWVAPVVIDSLVSPASAASIPPGIYKLRLASGRCNPTPVLPATVEGNCLPSGWANATLLITSDAMLASLNVTVVNCRPRYELILTSTNPSVTFLEGTSCKPANKGGGPNPGLVSGDSLSISWDTGAASDRMGYYILINVA